MDAIKKHFTEAQAQQYGRTSTHPSNQPLPIREKDIFIENNVTK
mgnify:CR=1 FL=1